MPGTTTTTTLPATVQRTDYRPPAWTADSVDIIFELFEDHALVTATTIYVPHPNAPSGARDLELDGRDLELVSLELDGHTVSDSNYRLEDETLTLTPPSVSRFQLRCVTRIEPQNNTVLEGLYRSGDIFCTQMEAEGFRRVTYFLDRPDVLAVYTTTIEADRARCPVLLGNGNLVATSDLPGGRHRATWHDPHRKPCYLFALVAGDLGHIEDEFTTTSGRTVELRIWVDKGNESRAEHAMLSLKKAMKWDQDVYGREYDLDVFNIVAVADFNMGAMENKGLNLFNSQAVLADARTSTDDDFVRIEGIIAHEYFHNWTGNRVTCRDWFQISLKEGLTVFRDQEFSSDMNSRAVQRIGDVRRLRAVQFPEDAGAMSHPIRPDAYITPDNFYTSTVYEKGAEVIRMLHTLLGPERFRKGTDLYFERHDGQAVTCDEFVAAMQDASGVDLKRFGRWYDQAGTPVLSITGSWDSLTKTYELVVQQGTPPTPGQPSKLALHIPLAVGLLDGQGHDLPLRLEGEDASAVATTRVLDVTLARQTFRFVDITEDPTPSLLRGFSAPVRLVTDQQPAALAFLAQNDSDPFNRWEAFQRLAMLELLRLVDERAHNRPLEMDAAFVRTFARILEDSTDPALVAETILLPSETALGDAMDVVDVDGIHAAREFALSALAAACRQRFETLHAELSGNGTDRSAAAIGRRRLANRALTYLTCLAEPAFDEACMEQLRSAETMTDELVALVLLANGSGPLREEAVALFRERWKEEPLVMNKWFAAQAGSLRECCVDDVEQLEADPLFTPDNPNKQRALYRTFSENQARFHAADGRGYRFLADRLLTIDTKNAIMAARMAAAFSTWKRFDAERQELMRAELERMASTEGLSPNLYEMLSRALA